MKIEFTILQKVKNLFVHILVFVNSCFHTKYNVRMYLLLMVTDEWEFGKML